MQKQRSTYQSKNVNRPSCGFGLQNTANHKPSALAGSTVTFEELIDWYPLKALH